MPYIDPARREIVSKGLDKAKSALEEVKNLDLNLVAGDLNYMVFSLALQYIKLKGKSYNNISDAIKALTGAAHEIERRVLDPYEDKAIAKNGDIEV